MGAKYSDCVVLSSSLIHSMEMVLSIVYDSFVRQGTLGGKDSFAELGTLGFLNSFKDLDTVGRSDSFNLIDIFHASDSFFDSGTLR